MSLDGILNDSSEVPEVEATKPESQQTDKNTETVEARADDVTVDKVETESAKEETEKPRQVPLTALQEERKKRQEAQKQHQELEKELSYLRGKIDSKEKPKEEESGFDNEKYWEEPDKVLDERERLLEQKILDRIWHKNALSDEKRVAAKHEDYWEKDAQFAELMKQDPSLSYAIRQTDNPAEYMYNYMTGLEIRTDPTKYREKISKEIEEKYKKDQAQAAAKSTPKTQAEARGSQPGQANVHQRSSLSGILGKTACNDIED